MPNSRLFAWSGAGAAASRLPALPRCSESPKLGSFVKLDENRDLPKSVLAGALDLEDFGVVVEDTGSATLPYLVQELVSGRISWYSEGVLKPFAEADVPDELLHNHPDNDSDGCYVTLSPDYRQQGDAVDGPLGLLRSQELYGLILIASGGRCRVRSCYNGKEWWYDHDALRKVRHCYVPEEQRAAVRPVWGDYVGLVPDHAQFGSAASGPLGTQELGLVVGVHHTPDAEGGLLKPCYTVRKCMTGQLFGYMEGALYYVSPHCIRAERMPPSNGEQRCQKLGLKLTLLHAGTDSPVPQGLVPGPRGDPECVQLVVPGERYLIRARMVCKDDDLALASLQPASWDLYASSGRSEQYIHLKPTATSTSSPAHEPLDVNSRLLPLSYCIRSCHREDGTVSGLYDELSTDLVTYDTEGDEAACVFQWNSGETPLVTAPGRISEVSFVSAVSFHGVPGTFKQVTTLLVKTKPSVTTPPTFLTPSSPETVHLSLPPSTPSPTGSCSQAAAASALGRSSPARNGEAGAEHSASPPGPHRASAEPATSRRGSVSAAGQSVNDDDSDSDSDVEVIQRSVGGQRGVADDDGIAEALRRMLQGL